MDSNTVVMVALVGMMGIGGYFAIKQIGAMSTGTQLSARQQRERDLLDKEIAGGVTLGTALALGSELGIDDWLGF